MSEDHFHALPSGFHLYEYRIQSVLGHGGFGITYLAWDTHLEKEVAIKEYLPVEFAVRQGEATVTPRSTGDEEDYFWGLERFLKEAQTLAMFRHPSIVPVFRFFEANGTAYIVMEYVTGDSLSAVMKKRPAQIDEKFALGILFPLLDGLAEVHKTGFLHRDIKPGNIYLRDDGFPVLLDFGAARDAVGRKSASLTAIVTPGYAPLEQYYADGNQGPWTDIYALGAILYQMATGSLPPEAPARVRNDPCVPAAQAGKGRFSKATLQAIDAALAVDETKRPQDTAAWRRMFPQQTGADGPARPPPGGRGTGLKVALGVGAGVLALAAIGGGLFIAGVVGPEATNKAPVALDDEAQTGRNSAVEIAVLANDRDPEGGALQIDRVTRPSNGTAKIGDGNVTYTPEADFEGRDSFDYTVVDPDGMTATASVAVEVRGVPNAPPVAVDDEADTVAGKPVAIDVLANDRDSDGDPLSIEATGQPGNGTVSVDSGTVTYTPAQGFSGDDRFTYTVSDGRGGEDEATVEVRVGAGNRPPVAVADAAITDQGEAVSVEVLNNDRDPDGDRLSVLNATDGLNGKTVTGPDGRITYTPSASFSGKDRFSYTVADDNGATDTTTVSITVRKKAEPPPTTDTTPPSDDTPPPSDQVQPCPYSADALDRYYGPGDCFHVQLVFERGISSPLGGPPHRWSNSGTGHSGSFKVEAETTTQSGTVCREFVQTVSANGQQHSARGKACFQGTSWRIQS